MKNIYTHKLQIFFSPFQNETKPIDKNKENVFLGEVLANKIVLKNDILIYHAWSIWGNYERIETHKDNLLDIEKLEKPILYQKSDKFSHNK